MSDKKETKKPVTGKPKVVKPKATPVTEPQGQPADESMVTIFVREYIEVAGLPPMFARIRYSVPESRLPDLPADKYVKV